MTWGPESKKYKGFSDFLGSGAHLEPKAHMAWGLKRKSTLLHLSYIAVAIDYIMIMDFRFGVNDFNPAAFSPTFPQGIAGQLSIMYISILRKPNLGF